MPRGKSVFEWPNYIMVSESLLIFYYVFLCEVKVMLRYRTTVHFKTIFTRDVNIRAKSWYVLRKIAVSEEKSASLVSEGRKFQTPRMREKWIKK